MLRLIIWAVVAWIVYRLLKIFFPQLFRRAPEVHGREATGQDRSNTRVEKKEDISDAEFTEIE